MVSRSAVFRWELDALHSTIVLRVTTYYCVLSMHYGTVLLLLRGWKQRAVSHVAL